MDDILTAIAGDPWSADLTLGAATIFLSSHNPRGRDFAIRFAKIAPNSKIVRIVK